MKTIRVEQDLESSLEEFVSKNALDLEVITKGRGTVKVEKTSDRLECSRSTLYSGGWITCATALAMAERLAIDTRQVGRMMDHLDIKIRRCGLGCFE